MVYEEWAKGEASPGASVVDPSLGRSWDTRPRRSGRLSSFSATKSDAAGTPVSVMNQGGRITERHDPTEGLVLALPEA